MQSKNPALRHRKGRPKPTPQQQRAIDLFLENLLNGGTKSITEILIEAGYSPASADQYTNIMVGIRPHLEPFVERMEKHRERVMTQMEARIEKAEYRDLARSLDILTHNIRLLSGKSTQNVGVIVEERRRELDRLLED
jgi:hypothetical protein